MWREELRVLGKTEKQQQQKQAQRAPLDLPTVGPSLEPRDFERGDGQIGVSEGKLTCREAGTEYGRPTTGLIPQFPLSPAVNSAALTVVRMVLMTSLLRLANPFPTRG